MLGVPTFSQPSELELMSAVIARPEWPANYDENSDFSRR